ncbi:MAG: GNAT family N-acetyltransferase [Salinivirgaceae bacterium]|nr:GNAT family N-acetyltransferase [Salinivirgaceae bacterium]
MFYESNDLIIRPYRSGDEPSLAFYSNNKQVAAQMPGWFPSPFTYDDALVWVADNMQSNSNFPIIYYGDVIGNIGLRNINGTEAELVLWIGPDFWNRKIGSRACQWFVSAAQKELGISSLHAFVKDGNIAAERIANALGVRIVR